MLKKSFAFILLALTLSPFNAPFQPGGGSEQQIAPIESLSVLRQDNESRAVIAQRSPESRGVTIAPLLETLFVSKTHGAGIVSAGTSRSASTGDFFPLDAVLRL